MMTWCEFQKVSEIQLDITGATFWVKFGPGGSRVKPGQIPFEMWPMSGDSFEPWFEDGITSGHAFRKFLGWRVFLGNQIWQLDPHEVVLVHEPDPDQPRMRRAPRSSVRS